MRAALVKGRRFVAPRRAATLALAASGLLLGHSAEAANTEIDVKAGGPYDLTQPATYTGAPTPGTTSDVTFTAGTTYTSSTGSPFTVPSNLSVGSINDLSIAAEVFIRNSTANDTLTLNGGDSVSGNTSDLIYVTGAAAGGTNLLIGSAGGVTLTLALGNSGNFDVATGAVLTIGANIGATTNSLTKTGAGTVNLNGNSLYTGATTVNAGTLNIIGTTSTSALTINGGTTTTSHDFTTAGASVTVNGGTLNNTNGGTYAYTGATIVNGGTLNTNALSSTSAVTLNGGALNMTGTNTYTGATTVNGGTLTVSGTSGSLGNTSGITVNAGGSVLLDSTSARNTTVGTARLATTVPVNLNAGTFSVLGRAAASAPVAETAGALSIGAGQSSVNATVGASGSTTTASFTTLNSIAKGGDILFTGTNLGVNAPASTTTATSNVTFGTAPTQVNSVLVGAIVSDGSTDFATYNATNGVARLAATTAYPGASASAAGNYVLSPLAGLTGAEVNTLKITTNSSDVTANLTGTLRPDSGLLFNGQFNPTLNGTGSLDFAMSGVNGYVYSTKGATGVVTLNVPITGGGNTTNNAVAIGGTGSFALNGGVAIGNGGSLYINTTNTVTLGSVVSAASVVVSNGKLALGVNNAFGTPVSPGGTAPTALSLNGGTLLRNGAGSGAGSGSTVGVGMLTMTAPSTLDFGTTGAGTLNFNGFNDPGNFLLTVNDYNNLTNGTRIDGTDDRLIFNQMLTSGQLADISFAGTAATQFALGNGEYEILAVSAVPEPSTWVAGVFCLGVLCYSRRRLLLRRLLA